MLKVMDRDTYPSVSFDTFVLSNLPVYRFKVST